MKIILTLVVCYIGLLEIIEPKKYRAIMNDELLSYERLDRNVPSYSEMFSTDNLIFEQTEDDIIFVSGHVIWFKSVNHKLHVQVNMRSQFLHQGSWTEGPLKLYIPDTCSELVNPSRFWYNITKLIKNDVCPPQKGDKWIIEPQNVSILLDLPSSFSLGPWRCYYLGTQGLPGFETFKFGMGFQFDLIPV